MVRDLKEVEVEKEERLVVVCEPRFLFGRMAVVFAFPLKVISFPCFHLTFQTFCFLYKQRL